MDATTRFQPRPDVTLAALTVEHAPNMYRWMCDPVVRTNVGLRSEPSLASTVAWIERALGDDSVRPWAILQDGRGHVGNVIMDRIDRYLGSVRLSVYVGEGGERGRGTGATAIYRAVEDAFTTGGLHKVWLTVHTRNTPAIQTYRRLGFCQEGVLRDEFWLDGQRVDVFYMGLLRDEWERLETTQ